MDSLSRLATQLQEAGLTVLWTEVTAPEAAAFGHVVKVIVPEMVPLAQDYNARWLATPRLRQAAGPDRAGALAWNPFPHPFT
jgi:hypothetical protein